MKNSFVNMVQTAKSKEIRKDLSAKTKECDEAEKRVKALDRIIQSLYEDKVCGNLTDERFVKMSQAYEQEQETLTERIKVLRKELSTAKEDADNVTKFYAACKTVHRDNRTYARSRKRVYRKGNRSPSRESKRQETPSR